MARRKHRRRRHNPSGKTLLTAGLVIAAGYGVLKVGEALGVVTMGATTPTTTPATEIDKTPDPNGYCTVAAGFTAELPKNKAWCESAGGFWTVGTQKTLTQGIGHLIRKIAKPIQGVGQYGWTYSNAFCDGSLPPQTGAVCVRVSGGYQWIAPIFAKPPRADI